MKINKEVMPWFIAIARIFFYVIMGLWAVWCMSSYTVDVYKRSHNKNNTAEIVWTNFKVADGVYSKVATNSLISSNALVILGLKKDGSVVWRIK